MFSTIEGSVSRVERRTNKQGREWATVTINDTDVEFFPKQYEKYCGALTQGASLSVEYRPSARANFALNATPN